MDEGTSILVGKGQESQTVVERRKGKIQDDASTQCNKVGLECGRDYSCEFITQEIFKSREALIKWARDVGRRNGFVIVIKTSTTGRHGKKPRIILGCERSGCYRNNRKNREVNTEKKMKLTASKKCGCPFSLLGKNLGTNNDWTLHVLCGVHNHPAENFREGHSYAGRLSEEETSLLVDMSKSMVRPKEILATLKQRCDLNVSTIKTIYNARYRKCKRAERTQMQQLFAQLAEHKYIEWHRKCDDTETVTDLLWTHPTSLDLLRAFPHVLIMDCICKTNRYHMPLLEIVGVTSTEKTFSVCFAYLQYECEDNYTWALGILRSVISEGALPSVIVTDREITLMKALSTVFPGATHFLCRWHINRNVSAKCKKLFETKEKWDRFIISWNMLVSSSTKEQFTQQLVMLNKEFNTYPEALEYVRCSWLDPYMDRFVAVWTDKSMHFGNTTTNMAESSHAQLKKELGLGQGTFESSWMKIHNLLELQHTDIKASFKKSKTVVQHNFKPSKFKELRGKISISALEKILVETKRANSVGVDQDACGCVIRHTHGLPCAHEIAEYIKEDRPIPLDCIHPHWCKLDMSATATPKSSSMELVPSEASDGSPLKKLKTT
ncbi:protein FAR1-RELATED SEQUENCE 2 isoform X2 [Cinnamomum micranthum f. kanehirae]|uniref:Protein FAR1-RELATED SEQUENCE 2 isoform X2 n=1 Tax=Cinnamomum micranthum f. kanehirae TaxID=337451 RepID=A0A443N7S9_9MAGN|nr:protein FAR1-RELATED SEQUENCE 2 isoform X2 [Cinnamomum micranthum f. kanehirae]